MAYCAIMTLLLAFFIILQAFAPKQSAGMFYEGQGSFVWALESFGLGGIFDRSGGSVLRGRPGARYRTSEGQDDPSRSRRIDAELEEAQRALQSVQDMFETQEPEDAVGYRVELSTPCTYGPGKSSLTAEETQFLRDLAPQLERVVLARGFVIRIGADLAPGGPEGPAGVRQALECAGRVRDELVRNMRPAAREVARRRVYSLARTVRGGEPAAATDQLKIDILLTKPFVRRLEPGKGNDGETSNAT